MATDFLFCGQRLSDFNFIVCCFDGEKPTISGGEIEINVVKPPSNDQYVFYGSSLNSVLEFKFSIMKNPCNKNQDELYLNSHEQSVISKWLKKRDNYHLVQFNEEGFEDIVYKVQTNLAPYLFNGKVIGYNVTMTSNCGYGFSNEIIIEETIDKNKPLYINLHNDTDSYSFPLITLSSSNQQKITLYNENDMYQNLANNKQTEINISSDIIKMDCENEIITGISEPTDFNYYYLRLVDGINKIVTDTEVNIKVVYRETREVVVC